LGKYGNYNKPGLREVRGDIHPIWRGLGFLLAIIAPIMAYAGAVLLVDENWKRGWVPIPSSLIGPPGYQNVFLVIVVTLVLLLFLYALFSLIYMVIYRLVGPSKYTPLDAPPNRRRKR